MKLKILILEDDQNRINLFQKHLIGHEVVVTDKVDECIDYLKEGGFHFLFLDHDLGGRVYVESGGDEPTGYDVAKWLSETEENIFILHTIVHSLNEWGRKNILGLLKDSKFNASEIPFIWTKDNLSEVLVETFNELTMKR